MGSSPISGTWLLSALLARVFEPHIGNSGTSTHLLFFLCASFCQTASPSRAPLTSLALDRLLLPLPRRLAPHASQELQRSSLAPSSPCVFFGLTRPSWVLAASSPMSGVEPTSGSSRLRARGPRRVSLALLTFPVPSGKAHPRVRERTPLSVGTVVLGGCRW